MPIPFLNSITLNKNEIQEFKVYNLTPDPTLTSAGDYGYMWLNTSDSPKTLKWWDGTSIRSIVDSGNTSTLTVGTANDLSGGVAGSLPYQQGVGDTTFLGIGSSGYILTSTGSAPQWSASIPSSSVSGLAASATTDTTNASNISSGTLGLARLSLASGQFYVGDGSNNPAATAKSSIPLSGFGNAAADINIGGFKITNSGTIGSGDADSTVATKGYVDSVAQGLDVKASCLVATTTDITLASPGAVTIDGIYSATDFTAGTTRILVKDQSAPAENGIYIWQGPSSAMTRSSDANTWDELVGAFTFIERGTANADSGWVCTVNAGGTLGTTAVTFVKFSQAGSYTAGNGIVQSGTSFNFAQSSAYTAGQIPFASSTTAMGFNANLHWDNSNNRLGIGTATPTDPLEVAGAIKSHNVRTTGFSSGARGVVTTTSNFYLLSSDTTTYGYGISGNAGGGLDIMANQASQDIRFFCGTSNASPTERLRIASDGVCTWSNVGGVVSNAMVLNGTGLGVGVSPLARVHSISNIAAANHDWTSQFVAPTVGLLAASNDSSAWIRIATYNSNPTHDPYLNFLTSGGQNWSIGIDNSDSDKLKVAMAAGFSGSNEFLTIDSSGNVGIGTTSPAYKLHVVTGAVATRQNLSSINRTTGNWVRFTNPEYSTDASMGLLMRPFPDSDARQGAGIIASGGSNNGITDVALFVSTGSTTSTSFAAYSTNIIGSSVGHTFYGSAGSAALMLDTSGNLGLGVTPSEWGYSGVYQTLYGSLFGLGNSLYLGNNWRYAAGTSYKLAAGYAHLFEQNRQLGTSTWYTSSAGAGAAGDTITFNPQMTLDASGNLLVNRASTIGTNSKLNVQLHGTSASTYSAPSNAAISVDAGTSDNCVIALVGGGDQGIYRANSSGAYDVGISLGSNAERRIQFNTAATTRLSIKSTGQVNFVGLASDPAGAAGDVVYNSTSNRLKYHNGTAWVNTGTNKYSGALAGTGTSFTVTHNLGTRDVTVAVRKSGSTYDQVFTDVQMTDTNTVTIVFASSVTGSDYTVTVIG